MDTLTHALSGALLARATHTARQQLSPATRVVIGALACAFPDSDFVLRWVDILYYFNWHRGVTHSLVLLPLWAGAGALLLHYVSRHRWPLGELFRLLLLTIGLHILGDLITAYGTRIWMPLSTARVGWDTTFIIDLVFTGIIVAGLLASWLTHSTTAARIGCIALVAYVGLQALLHQHALQIAQDYATRRHLDAKRVVALPQPLSALNWKLLVEEDGQYHTAYLRIKGESNVPDWLTWLQPVAHQYREEAQLRWKTVHRLGNTESALVQQVWRQDALAEYRRFAEFPRLYRIDRNPEQLCVWFTDERFVLPGLTPPFRFGLCRQGTAGDWQLRQLPRVLGTEAGTT